jgi:multiple antibiotic resistance protein
MLSNTQIILFTFAALFPVLNPLAGAMIFLNLTRGAPRNLLNKLALEVSLNTFILLVVVLFTGSWILTFFGITIPIVEIAGGFVVACLGWTVLNQPVTEPDQNAALPNDKAVKDMAFFPLTMPLTAGPGCFAVTLAISAHETHKKLIDTIMGQASATIGILLAAFSVFVCYRYAKSITKKLGPTGSSVIMKLSAFINVCIGLQIMWRGVQGLLTGIAQ